MPDPDVRPGQIWADCDWRYAGRTLRIEPRDVWPAPDRARCTVLTNADDAQERIDSGATWLTDRRGKTTDIRLDRFKPTSTGYRLVQDVAGGGQ